MKFIKGFVRTAIGLLIALVFVTGCSESPKLPDTPEAVHYSVIKEDDISVNRRRRMEIVVTAPAAKSPQQSGDTAIKAAVDFIYNNPHYKFVVARVVPNEHMVSPILFTLAVAEHSPDGKGVNPDAKAEDENILNVKAVKAFPPEEAILYMSKHNELYYDYDSNADGEVSDEEYKKLEAFLEERYNPSNIDMGRYAYFPIEPYYTHGQ